MAKAIKEEVNLSWKELVAFITKVKRGKAILTKDSRYNRYVIEAGENKIGKAGLPVLAGEVFIHKSLKQVPDKIRLVVKEGK